MRRTISNSCKCTFKEKSCNFESEFKSLWSLYCIKFIDLLTVAKSEGQSSSMYRSIYLCRKVSTVFLNSFKVKIENYSLVNNKT